MKFMIRRESNQFDIRMTMYNVYDADKYIAGQANGYKYGSLNLEDARAYIAAQAIPKASELIEEITV